MKTKVYAVATLLVVLGLSWFNYSLMQKYNGAMRANKILSNIIAEPVPVLMSVDDRTGDVQITINGNKMPVFFGACSGYSPFF